MHDIQSGFQSIGHIKHRQNRSFTQKTSVMSGLQRIVVNRNGIIRSSTAWRTLITNQTGIAQTAGINAPTVIVILCIELTRQFTDTIDRCGIHCSILRCAKTFCIWSKSRDTTRPINSFDDACITSRIQHVKQTFHVQFPTEFWIFLGRCTQ